MGGESDKMIELLPSENDDPAFVELVVRIINGAVMSLHAREVYLVHVDNWFDHKWLGWGSRWKHSELMELYIPAFNPNRIRSQKRFIWEPKNSKWMLTGQGTILHRRQPGPGRRATTLRLDDLPESAAFIWYSGNSATNCAGSLMLYLSGADDYAWYTSFKKIERWSFADEFRITRRELESFEKHGRQLGLSRTQGIPG
jgi:hypothetical protein